MDEKRKYTVDKNVFLFTNGDYDEKCGGLYEFKISVTKWSDGKYVIDSNYKQGEKLEATQTFYDRRNMPEIHSVAACVLSPNLLYLIPHDEPMVLPDDPVIPLLGNRDDLKKALLEQRHSLAPCLFHLSLNKMITKGIEFPLARKIEPKLIFIGNKVFALSSPWPFIKCPEPCFESLVVVTNDDYDRYNNNNRRWTPLACPPFHTLGNDPTGLLDFSVMGVAVLDEEGLILVSVVDREQTACYFSYNIRYDKWSPVQVGNTPSEDVFLFPPFLHENAAVVNNNIYTYHSSYAKLLVLPYTITDTGGDLSLGVMSLVEGFQLDQNYDDFGNYPPGTDRTGTVTKVDENILCVIHTKCPYDFTVQNLWITFIQLVGDGNKCTTLKSFTCTLSNGTEFQTQAIKSCFVLNDFEEKSDHRSGKRPVVPSDADDKASMEMNLSGTRERDAQEVDAM